MLHRVITSLLVLSAVALSCRAEAAEVQHVRLLINGSELTAELADGAAARDFQALLPLRLPLQDFNSTEKISDLPERLSTSGEPEGFEYCMIGGHFTGSLVRHVMESIAMHAGICLHLQVISGRDPHHIAEAEFKALARALRFAIESDPRVDGIPSTKGAL